MSRTESYPIMDSVCYIGRQGLWSAKGIGSGLILFLKMKWTASVCIADSTRRTPDLFYSYYRNAIFLLEIGLFLAQFSLKTSPKVAVGPDLYWLHEYDFGRLHSSCGSEQIYAQSRCLHKQIPHQHNHKTMGFTM